ncbi:hypothetical protein [Streptomyces sioyaensis]|uniref:hypothetical protein n=1 Tax=Streptomyces sioyaensis TaxID=67364 RepID=UPI0036E1985E
MANQHRRNDKHAARHGAVILHRWTDNDLSASKRGVVRPDFQAMLRDHARRSAGPHRRPQSAIRNPQSAIRNPQSAIRNPRQASTD